MRDRKLARLDVGKDAQDGVLAGTGIDVDAIAREPGEELRFGMHTAGGLARRQGANNFCGLAPHARLRGGVLFAQAVTNTYFIDLSAYPRWLVVLVGTLVAALFIWILMKLLKWALWILFFVVLVGGVFWSVYLLAN